MIFGLMCLMGTSPLLHYSSDIFPKAVDAASQSFLEQVLRSEVDSDGYPAIYAAASVRGRIVAISAQGKRRLDTNASARVDDFLMIGSISKSVTAATMATLIAQKKLTWETSIREALPKVAKEFPSHPSLDANLIDLFQHKSGLPNGDVHAHLDSTPVGWRQFLVNSMFSKSPVGDLREKTVYAAGATVAAAMAETILNKPYEAICDETLLRPMGLTSFGWGKPWEKYADQPKGIAFLDGDRTMPKDGWNIYIKNDPSGGMHCNISDLCRYASIFAVGEHRGLPGLPTSAVKRLNEILGGNPRSWGGATGLGDYSQIYVDPKNEFALAIVVLLDSERGGQTKVNNIQNKIVKAFNGG